MVKTKTSAGGLLMECKRLHKGPLCMAAVWKRKEDVPFNTQDPVFKYGDGLSYDDEY
jgi:hypothetical protein